MFWFSGNPIHTSFDCRFYSFIFNWFLISQVSFIQGVDLSGVTWQFLTCFSSLFQKNSIDFEWEISLFFYKYPYLPSLREVKRVHWLISRLNPIDLKDLLTICQQDLIFRPISWSGGDVIHLSFGTALLFPYYQYIFFKRSLK